MARARTASKPAEPAAAQAGGGLKCPYCFSNLRPERASVADGTVEGSRTSLALVPRTDPPAEPIAKATKPAKRKVALSGKSPAGVSR